MDDNNVKTAQGAQTCNICVGALLIIWVPVIAVWVLFGFGYLVWQGAEWYGSAISDWLRPAWYAYPWSWPGPTLAEFLWTHMGQSPWASIQDPIQALSYFPRYLFALLVNMTVASIPLIAIAFVFRVVRGRLAV